MGHRVAKPGKRLTHSGAGIQGWPLFLQGAAGQTSQCAPGVPSPGPSSSDLGGQRAASRDLILEGLGAAAVQARGDACDRLRRARLWGEAKPEVDVPCWASDFVPRQQEAPAGVEGSECVLCATKSAARLSAETAGC